MTELVVKVIIGIIIGIICGFVYSRLEILILNKRDLEVRTFKIEHIITFVLAAIYGAAIMIKFELVTEIIYAFIILTICMLVAVIDLHHRIIPNKLLLALLIVKLGIGIPALLGVEGFPKFNFVYSLIGLVVGFIIFILPAATGKTVGAGDIKLAAAIGFCLGVMGLLYSIVLMGGLIIAFTIVQKNRTFRQMIYEMIPMGPFMAIATLAVMIPQ